MITIFFQQVEKPLKTSYAALQGGKKYILIALSYFF